VKVLTLIQPWATCIVEGPKRVENRSWQPPEKMIGQAILLHAGRKFDHDAHRFILKRVDRRYRPHFERGPEFFPSGQIIGMARIARVVTDPLKLPVDQVQWFFGPFGWLLEDVVRFSPGIHAMGALNLWECPAHVLDNLDPHPDDAEIAARYLRRAG
jgi:hypothetical protein